MASEWKPLKIGDAFDLVCGYAFKSSDFRDEGVPVIKIKNVKADGVVLDNLDFVDAKFLDLRKDKIVRDGDILITMSGNRFDGSPDTWVGKVAQYRGTSRFLLNQRVGILRPKCPSDVDQRACTYFLASEANQHLFIAIATSSGGQANLSPSQILGAELILPPLEEQQLIAHILGTLDDKIELNRQINETLGAMARALFQSWFVDFDPVRAKAEGRDHHLPADIAALFPDSFEPSPIGDIPKGWSEKSLADITSYLNRGISPSYLEEGGTLVLNQKCIRDGRIDQSKGRRHDATKRSINGRTLRTGDILINSTGVGTLGRVAQLLTLCEDAIVDSHVTVVRANGVDVSWNYLGMCLALRESEIESLGEGSTGQTELSRSRLSKMTIVLPAPEVTKEFDRRCIPLRTRIAASEEEGRTLASLRDALLPKLISGEVRLNRFGPDTQERDS